MPQEVEAGDGLVEEPAPLSAHHPTRPSLITAEFSIGPSEQPHLREWARRLCDQILAGSHCRYRMHRDTMRIQGEIGAVCTAIKRCEQAMHRHALANLEIRLSSHTGKADSAGAPFWLTGTRPETNQSPAESTHRIGPSHGAASSEQHPEPLAGQDS